MSDNDNEQLRYSKRMEAVGKMSAPVAHDINNLLSGIMGYSELLLSERHRASKTLY
jgi:signal transduction histidine kinase